MPIIFGFWLLTRKLAFVLLAAIGATHAVLLAVTPDLLAPASQWAFLLAVLAAAGVLIGGMVDETDRAGHAEIEARRALALVNLRRALTDP